MSHSRILLPNLKNKYLVEPINTRPSHQVEKTLAASTYGKGAMNKQSPASNVVAH